MPYRNFHSARFESPDKFEKYKYKKNFFENGIDVVFGVRDEDKKGERGGLTKIQAIRFNNKYFSPEKAKKWAEKWANENNENILKFEPAKEDLKESVFDTLWEDLLETL